MKFTLTKLLVY